VSFKTSFDLKQPKLEPKIVSALSETKQFYWLFCFYTETESFDVSNEPNNRKPTETVDREHILVFIRKFSVVSVCFKAVLFVLIFSI
jgi:hypothetical protein